MLLTFIGLSDIWCMHSYLVYQTLNIMFNILNTLLPRYHETHLNAKCHEVTLNDEFIGR